ncbi:MAG: hypothetical protein ACF8PN_01465 [Phycisphaerales bacterium]
MAKRAKATVRNGRDRSGSLQKIMDLASEALVGGRYFECERLANQALHQAWDAGDYDSMARITMPLQEARRQRRLNAIDAGHIVLYDEDNPPPGAEAEYKPGVYIVTPPFVAADARVIAETSFESDAPTFSFACEPRTQLGLTPVVVVGPIVLRARIKPARQPDSAWCLGVIDALTEVALDTLDPTRPLPRQVDEVMDRLDALPESELLHQKLVEIAHAALHEENGVETEPDGASAIDEKPVKSGKAKKRAKSRRKAARKTGARSSKASASTVTDESE